MSHKTVIATQFKNISALKTAIEKVSPQWAGKIEVAQNGKNLTWHGYSGTQRAEAQLVVKGVGTFGNDLGFSRQPNGTYLLLADAYDINNDKVADKKWQDKLKQRYATEVVIASQRKLGRRYRETVKPNGAIVLTVEV